jgi:hypothetical protein
MNESAGFPQELTDAANRMRDAVNLHVVAGTFGVRERHLQWLAIRLEDGRSDGTVYESRRDAVRHTMNREKGWFYVKVGADSMGERAAIIVLQMARQAFRNGVVFAEEEPVVPMLSELALPFIPRTINRLSGNIILPQRRNQK